MKICCSNKYGTWRDAKTGKGFFAQRLIKALIASGVDVIEDRNAKVDIDLQFGKYTYEPKSAKSVIRMGPPHIGKTHYAGNKRKREALKRADAIIYQSKFGRMMCDKFLGEFKGGLSSVIFNGAPSNCEDAGRVMNNAPVFIASTRDWTGQKRLNSILKAFCLADIPDSGMLVLGDCEKVIKKPKIYYLGLKTQDVIANLLRDANIMVSIVWLDCMPNSVCEALCAGCKVITTSTSGTPEIAPDLVLQEKPWDFKPCDNDSPPKVDLNALAELMRKSLTMPKPYFGHVDIDFIAKQYIDFFGEVLDGRS